MNTRRSLAVGLVFTLIAATTPISLGAEGAVSMSGTAKNEARKPYGDYTARARDVRLGQIAGMTNLDNSGNFSLTNLQPANYVVELLDRNGKIVCTEGPFDMTRDTVRDNIHISCGKVPAAWWLLGAAAAAGITAGIVATGPASAAQ
jgi:hypothetical protein